MMTARASSIQSMFGLRREVHVAESILDAVNQPSTPEVGLRFGDCLPDTFDGLGHVFPRRTVERDRRGSRDVLAALSRAVGHAEKDVQLRRPSVDDVEVFRW